MRIDLKHLREFFACGVAIAAIECLRAGVHQHIGLLFDLAALRFRFFDAFGSLVIRDVDQKDARPEIDRFLIIVRLRGAIALGQVLLNSFLIVRTGLDRRGGEVEFARRRRRVFGLRRIE